MLLKKSTEKSRDNIPFSQNQTISIHIKKLIEPCYTAFYSPLNINNI